MLKNSSQPGAVYDSVHKQVVLMLNGAPHCRRRRRLQATPTGCGFNLQMISKDGVRPTTAHHPPAARRSPFPERCCGLQGVTWGEPIPLDGQLGKDGYAAAGHAGLELTKGPHKGRLLFIG